MSFFPPGDRLVITGEVAIGYSTPVLLSASPPLRFSVGSNQRYIYLSISVLYNFLIPISFNSRLLVWERDLATCVWFGVAGGPSSSRGWRGWRS